METVYKLENIYRTYQKGKKGHSFCALQLEELIIPKGKITAIVGYSGSGKTTLLNILGLLDSPDFNENASLIINGKYLNFQNIGRKPKWGFIDDSIPFAMFRRDNLGFIFQDNYMPKALSVKQAFMFGKSHGDLPIDVKQALSEVGLSLGFEKKRICDLSGGEAQRVALAIAKSKNPEIILADELTSCLDYSTAKNILKLLSDWVSKENKTVVWVSHHLHQVCDFAHHVYTIADGKIIGECENECFTSTAEDKRKARNDLLHKLEQSLVKNDIKK